VGSGRVGKVVGGNGVGSGVGGLITVGVGAGVPLQPAAPKTNAITISDVAHGPKYSLLTVS
jgi:hypothetical protein